MGALRFPGSPAVVTIASAMTGNAGTSAYTMRVKSGPAGITLPASGLAAFIGTSSNANQTGLITNSAGRVMIYTGATLRYGSANGFLQTGVAFDITLTHNSDGTWSFYDNINSVTNSSGTFATSTTFGNLNQFGRASSTNATYLQGDIEIIEVTGLVNAQKWDANLSGGSGSTLPTASGTNQGTLSGFDTAVCWVDFTTAINFASTAYSTSIAQSQLSTAINLASSSYSTSASTSDIVAGAINFASMSYSTSIAFSNMATQIRLLSDSRSTSRSVSDLGNDTPTFNSMAYSTSNSQSQLNTAIQFASSVKSTSISYSNLTDESIARYLERWDGLNFNAHPLERWNGTQYLRHPLERWDGEQWVRYNG